nr:MAG TPA: hypothetical protein [Bacteriophage sp.]
MRQACLNRFLTFLDLIYLLIDRLKLIKKLIERIV